MNFYLICVVDVLVFAVLNLPRTSSGELTFFFQICSIRYGIYFVPLLLHKSVFQPAVRHIWFRFIWDLIELLYRAGF
jgi:hypothetical protein